MLIRHEQCRRYIGFGCHGEVTQVPALAASAVVDPLEHVGSKMAFELLFGRRELQAGGRVASRRDYLD